MSIIRTITIRNFRCLEKETFDISAPVVVVLGENGSGKTSLLEALFYATGLRSFKTRSPRECICWGTESFVVTVNGDNQGEPWELRICVTTAGERLVKLNGTPIASWQEAITQCNTVAISEEDLSLVGGAPEERRRFIDHAISLEDNAYLQQLVILRRLVRQKNALLTTGYCSFEAYASWTEQLNTISNLIRATRMAYLEKLETTIQKLMIRHQLDTMAVSLTYQNNEAGDECSERQLFARECAARRTLAGAHLDDLVILLNGQSARQFASRGQQKMVAFLLKAGAIALLSRPTLILVDDFMTDFDEKNAATLLELAKKLGGQLILTAPQTGCLPRALLDQITLYVKLTTKNMPYCKKADEKLARQ